MVASVTNLREYIKEGIASLLKKETSALDEVIGNSSSHRLVDLVETDAALEETAIDMEEEDEPQKEIEPEAYEEVGETDQNEPDGTQCDFDEDDEEILSVTGTRCTCSHLPLNSLASNYLAKKLLNALEQRLQKLTDTIQFKVSLYIDLRFNYMGSNRTTATDKERSQSYMLQLWTRLNALEGKHEDQQNMFTEPNDEASDFVEQYLVRYFERDSPGTGGRMQPAEDKILQQIKELQLRPKVRIRVGGLDASSSEERFDIFKYWIGMRTNHRDVFRMAFAILSAPSTQVTVERAFIGFKLVLTDQRQRLSDQRIQDLM
ncbi:uncharacterized protein LOC135699781 [Ochlerotatus camptorhynchus]|uniref:uncharacterized protein LOC135699781 n=1 Tax=Ochlerotatus camptorhynchus TaxID=644619 RepID=UPI0031DD3206